MVRGRRSNDSEGNEAIQNFEAPLWAAADELRNSPDRKKQIKILGLNLSIAAADIIVFSPGLLGVDLFGAGALETAFGSTIIFLSAVGVIYGNYRLLAEPEKSIPIEEYYTKALTEQRGHKTFEETIDLAIDQIARLEKKNKNIRNILPQTFGDSEITCNKFAAANAEVKNAFFMNIQIILNKLDTFDEADYDFIREKNEAKTVSQSIKEDKLAVYNKYVTSIKAAAEDNEKILIMLDKLQLGISELRCPDASQRTEMTEMIDDLIEQLKYYKK